MKTQFVSVRELSRSLCKPLETEDYVVQTIFDASPVKWHLAHTTWFFEEFILSKYQENYKRFNAHYGFLFNSYYNAVGERVSKDLRGVLSRPTVKEIYEYRDSITENLNSFLESELYESKKKEIDSLLEIGINHEQQHQELMMYDIKHIFFMNPLKPIYSLTKPIEISNKFELKFIPIDAGLYSIGKNDDEKFGFDNEYPNHQVYLNSYTIANQLVTNGDYLEFINSDGYTNPLFWLSDGWDFINNESVSHPLYWEKRENEWFEWTFYGWEKLNMDRPVSHISYYEAEGFARWKNKRLPTEAEWEVFALKFGSESSENFIDDNNFTGMPSSNNISHIKGDLWEWTASPYTAYPKFKQADGAIGEYNGKFMINQMVLRGGSYGTSKDHFRETYRNFFQADKRWLFNGIRLAE